MPCKCLQCTWWARTACHGCPPCAGYMVSRMLGAAPVLADAVIEQLCRASDAAADAHQPLGAASEAEADRLSAVVWHSIWPVQRCAPCHLGKDNTPVCKVREGEAGGGVHDNQGAHGRGLGFCFKGC